MSRILLIDDHAIVRLGMRSLLETRKEFEVAAEAGTRREALCLLKNIMGPNASEQCPDLAVVDLVLGQDDGLEFVKELKALCPDMRVLVVTMQNEAIYAERVLRAGADGFLQKRDATQYLLDAVEVVCGGQIYVSRATRARVLDERLKDGDPKEESPMSSVSDRELHVFQMVGTGLANREIAEHLGLSTKTIESYKENLKRKLEIRDAKTLRDAAERWVETGKY